jgi:poly(A) polymerase Pap1
MGLTAAGADIDTLLVGPLLVTRVDFFSVIRRSAFFVVQATYVSSD